MITVGIPFKPYLISYKILTREYKDSVLHENVENYLYQVLTIAENEKVAISTADQFVNEKIQDDQSKGEKKFPLFQECKLFTEEDRILKRSVFRIIV